RLLIRLLKENTWVIPNQATGSTIWMSNITSDFGPRCTQIYALQVADNVTTDFPPPRFWSCFSNVSTVDGIDEYLGLYPNASQYRISDDQASVLAGAIGWSGVITTDDNGTLSFTTPEWQL